MVCVLLSSYQSDLLASGIGFNLTSHLFSCQLSWLLRSLNAFKSIRYWVCKYKHASVTHCEHILKCFNSVFSWFRQEAALLDMAVDFPWLFILQIKGYTGLRVSRLFFHSTIFIEAIRTCIFLRGTSAIVFIL